MQLTGNRFGQRRRMLRVVDVVELAHPPQHIGATALRLFAAGHRVVARRRLREPRKQRRLGDRDAGQRLAEVGLRRRRDAIGPLAEEDRVQVQLEDLLLAQLVLEGQRQEDLAQLAPQGPLVLDQRGPYQLLGERAAALPHFQRAGRNEQRAQHALPVDARVLEEPVVFGGQERLDHRWGHLAELDRQPALLADLADEQTVPAVHSERELQLELPDLGDVWQCGLEVIIGSQEGETDQRRDRHDAGRNHQ